MGSLSHELKESKKISISSCLLPVSPAAGEGLCDLQSTDAAGEAQAAAAPLLAGKRIHVAGKKDTCGGKKERPCATGCRVTTNHTRHSHSDMFNA